jgi:hypothetical protein
MLNFLGFGKTPWDKLAVNVSTTTLEVSGNWFKNMNAALPSLDEKRFAVMLWESMAFFMSVVLSEVMQKKKGSTKEEFEKYYRELGMAIGNVGIAQPSFFSYAMFPVENDFKASTLEYYRGVFSESYVGTMRHYAHRYELNMPDKPGFEMATMAFICELLRYGEVEKIGLHNIEKGAVLVLLEIMDKNLRAFISNTRNLL